MNNKLTVKNMEFSGDTESEARKKFEDWLGDESQWFSDLLYAIKEEWIDQGGIITDILVREGMPVYVATVKAYVPFVTKSITKLPNKKSIYTIMQKFVMQTIAELEGKVADFSFYVMGLGIFRCNFSEDSTRTALSIRYLNFILPTFEDIGYPDFYTEFIKNTVIENTIKTPKGLFRVAAVNTGGLILHIGATGSGKTTSIAAEIGYIAEKTSGTIITYENPIEYRFIATKAPVRQFEIDRDIESKKENEPVFDNIKRHLLRNNPSVVMIGEARDNYEIKSMLDFSSRGHLVFGTIHASNVKEALTTLMAVSKDEPYLLANSLQAIIAHKLVTGSDGSIVPLFEIMIPDVTVRNKIAESNLKHLENVFYKEKQLPNSMTFSTCLEKMVKEKRLTPNDARDIKKSNFGLFF